MLPRRKFIAFDHKGNTTRFAELFFFGAKIMTSRADGPVLVVSVLISKACRQQSKRSPREIGNGQKKFECGVDHI